MLPIQFKCEKKMHVGLADLIVGPTCISFTLVHYSDHIYHLDVPYTEDEPLACSQLFLTCTFQSFFS